MRSAMQHHMRPLLTLVLAAVLATGGFAPCRPCERLGGQPPLGGHVGGQPPTGSGTPRH